MGKALTGKLSCPVTGLASFFLFIKNKFYIESSEDSEQPGHLSILIGVFTVNMEKVKTLIRLGRCPG